MPAPLRHPVSITREPIPRAVDWSGTGGLDSFQDGMGASPRGRGAMAASSIIIPAYNESRAIVKTIEAVEAAFANSEHAFEIIVVDDASDDDTATLAFEAGVRVITHPTNKGYGNALLTGVRNALHAWIAIADADGTYPLERLPELLEIAESRDLDMVVGARQGEHYDGRPLQRLLRGAFQRLSEWVVGDPIPDINSGFRVIRRELVTAFASALSGGFSFTTSITIMAFQTGHHVGYVPVAYYRRTGKSHVRMWRDSRRALQIIVMTIVLFNPIKLYLLQAALVLVYTLFSCALVLVLPQLFGPVLLASAGILTANITMALGFIAVRQQMNLSDINLPRRGYTPRPVLTAGALDGGE